MSEGLSPKKVRRVIKDIEERRKACQTFGNRPRNNWGEGGLPAPWCEGDVVRQVAPLSADRLESTGEPYDRLRGQTGPLFVVIYATSIGEGDEWYFRLWDGSRPGCSDRMHVIPPDTDWMSSFELVETVDPQGMAEREQMLADGWSYTPPPICPTCGQEDRRPVHFGREAQP